MTLQEFIKKYTGQRVDHDGAYGAQCVDLYRFYLKEVWQKPQTPGVKGAYQIFDTLPAGYEKERNSPTNFPRPGDVIIWNEKQVTNGHVGIVTRADVNSFDAFQQNAPKSDTQGKTGSPCNTARYTYKNITGWFRPKSESPTPNPPPETKMTIHKNLILLNGLTENETTCLKQAAEHIKNRIAALGDIRVEIDYLTTDRIYNTETGPTTTPGNTATWAKPTEIAAEGRKGEILLSKEFDLVTLVYDVLKTSGPAPTNPVENPMTIEGFNINSLPNNWFSNREINQVYFDSARLFLYHELLHSWYYIINSEVGAGQTDRVHDWKGEYSGGTDQTLEGNMRYFDDLAKSLKPWWPALANSAASTEERSNMLALEHKGTIYVAIFSKFVPIGDPDTFLELGGNWNAVKKLSDAEFASIVQPLLAKSTILK